MTAKKVPGGSIREASLAWVRCPFPGPWRGESGLEWRTHDGRHGAMYVDARLRGFEYGDKLLTAEQAMDVLVGALGDMSSATLWRNPITVTLEVPREGVEQEVRRVFDLLPPGSYTETHVGRGRVLLYAESVLALRPDDSVSRL